jgi:DNA polymerase
MGLPVLNIETYIDLNLHATIDFETKSECEIKKTGSWIYSKHPTTDVFCLAYRLPYWPEGKVELWHRSHDQFFIAESEIPYELFKWIEQGGLVEAHNAFFERVIWRHIMTPRYGWPEVPENQWRCSASRASAASLPRDLENACKAMGLPIEKDMEGRRLMLKMAKPRKPRKSERQEWRAKHGRDTPMPTLWHEEEEDIYRLWEYCKQDVRAEEALSDVIPALSDRELSLWQLDQEINISGAQVDLKLAKAALYIAEEAKKRMNSELEDMTGISAATKREQVKNWLRENENLDLPDTQAATLDKFLQMPEVEGRARRVLQLVKLVNKTSTRKYQAALDKTDHEDGRARDILMYHGAGTGRWSGKGIQVQNFPRGKAKNVSYFDEKTGKYKSVFDMDVAANDILDQNPDWLEAFYDGGTMEALSSALRGLIIPSIDNDLIVADYSAIEARCVLWEAGCEKALETFRNGGDIYCDMAEGIYGYPVNRHDHPEERQFGKQAILGLGYGMGFLTFLLTCRKYDISFSKQQVAKILQDKYEKYYNWVNDYLFPGKEAKPLKKREASRVLRILIDADENPKAIIHELALMKYTVDVYRTRYPEVKAMWKEQEEAAIAAIKGWEALVKQTLGAVAEVTPEYIEQRDKLTGPCYVSGKIKWFVKGGFLCCQLPSGRLVRYRDPLVKPTKTSWGEVKDGIRYMSLAKGKWVRTASYGGKLVENITQAVARDIMADAMLRCKDTIYRVFMTVHDEMVGEVPKNKGSLEEFEELMSEIEPWAEGCPITAEAERYSRYRK